jgi:hypothetical protein
LKDEVEKTLYECAHQEKLLEQERQSRISLETAKVQELTQAKGDYLTLKREAFFKSGCLILVI